MNALEKSLALHREGLAGWETQSPSWSPSQHFAKVREFLDSQTAPALPSHAWCASVDDELEATAGEDAKHGSEDSWRCLFWSVARALNCLPSTYVDSNAHVYKQAQKYAAIATLQSASQPQAAPPTIGPATRDALLDVAIKFIGTLTGMMPPPIEVAPPEVFAPFHEFVTEVELVILAAASATKEQAA